MSRLKESPSQTAGPYVHIGLATEEAGFKVFEPFGTDIAGPDAAGERIRVEGRVLDGDGAPMTDALVEVWQADASGAYPDGRTNTGFTGFGRVVPDFNTGAFSFDTIKPGLVSGDGLPTEAPHLNLWVVARGINLGLHTRMYFSDEGEANSADPTLASIDPDRRETLIASRTEAGGIALYHFDIRVQGDKETVFFDV